MIIDELFIKLGYDADTDGMKKFNAIGGKTVALMKGLTLSMIGFTTAAGLMFAKISSNALAQKRFGQAIDVSRGNIEALERTSSELTGDSGAANSLLEQFNSITNAMKAGIAPSTEFLRGIGELGIGFDDFLKLKPDEALLLVSSRFQDLDGDTADAVTSLLGFGSAQRNLVEGLNEDVFRKNLPTQADLDSIENLNTLMKDTSQIINDLIVSLGTPLLSELEPQLEKLRDIAPEIVEAVRNMSSSLTGFGTELGKTISDAVRLIKDFKEELGGIGTSLGEGVFEIKNSIENFISDPIGFVAGQSGNSSSSSSSSVSQNIEINVRGSNPNEIAETIRRVTEEQLINARNNLTSDVTN